MREILTAYACANDFDLRLKGCVQLSCIIYLFTKSATYTFNILQTLTDIMLPYYFNDEELIKNQTLVLSDVICDDTGRGMIFDGNFAKKLGLYCGLLAVFARLFFVFFVFFFFLKSEE